MTDFPPPSDSSPSNSAPFSPPSDSRPTGSPSWAPGAPSSSHPSAPPPLSTPPGYVAHQPGLPPSFGAATSGNWVGAILVAIGMQIGAVVAFVVTVTILFVAAFSTWGGSGESPAWTLAALPVGLASIALYIGSGYVAARIARDRKGWLMLIVGPFATGTVLTLLSSIASVFG